MLFDGPLVQRVEHGDLGDAALSLDGRGDRLEGLLGPPNQKDRRPLPGEGAGDGASDVAAGPIHDRVLVLQQPSHLVAPPICGDLFGRLRQLVGAGGRFSTSTRE